MGGTRGGGRGAGEVGLEGLTGLVVKTVGPRAGRTGLFAREPYRGGNCSPASPSPPSAMTDEPAEPRTPPPSPPPVAASAPADQSAPSSSILARTKKVLSLESTLGLVSIAFLLLVPLLSASLLAVECAYLSTQALGADRLVERLVMRETAPFRLRGAAASTPQPGMPCTPALRVIRGEPSLSRFATLLEEVWPLSLGIGDGQPFTIFAPTNIAWRHWERDAKHAADPMDNKMLRAHFAPGLLGSGALAAAGEGALVPPPKGSHPLRVAGAKSGLPTGVRPLQGGWGGRIVKADVAACNSVIHLVDAVLIS